MLLSLVEKIMRHPVQAIEHRVTKFSADLTRDDKKDRATYRSSAPYRYKVQDSELTRAVKNYTKSTGTGAVAGALIGWNQKSRWNGCRAWRFSRRRQHWLQSEQPHRQTVSDRESPASNQIQRLVPAAAVVAALLAGRRKFKNMTAGAKKFDRHFQ